MTISPLSYTQKEYAELIFQKLGRGYNHALKVYSQWMKTGAVSAGDDWIEPQARPLLEKMLECTDFTLPALSEEKSEGRLCKFLLRHEDLLESETVIIPMLFGTTLCISSQVGCRMGCAFCQTAKMGLLRSLSAKEIVSQVFIAMHHFKQKVRNIVFMGMGEPLDNYEAVMQAVAVLTCPAGIGLGMSRITISTSGHVDHILRLSKEAHPALNLAVSVNAPTDEIRSKIMPVNRRWDMDQLKSAMLTFLEHPRREILAEYVLIKGVNDSPGHALLLSKYLQGLRVRVNLIPYNPQQRDVFEAPSEDVTEAFLSLMRQEGFQTLLRSTKGQNISAACGQLGNKEQRKKLFCLPS